MSLFKLSPKKLFWYSRPEKSRITSSGPQGYLQKSPFSCVVVNWTSKVHCLPFLNSRVNRHPFPVRWVRCCWQEAPPLKSRKWAVERISVEFGPRSLRPKTTNPPRRARGLGCRMISMEESLFDEIYHTKHTFPSTGHWASLWKTRKSWLRMEHKKEYKETCFGDEFIPYASNFTMSGVMSNGLVKEEYLKVSFRRKPVTSPQHFHLCRPKIFQNSTWYDSSSIDSFGTSRTHKQDARGHH